MAELPRYRLTQTAHLPPLTLDMTKAGTIISYSGIPGPHMEPLNDAARDALKQYYEEHPDATLQPTDNLSLTMDGRPRPALVRIEAEAPAQVIDVRSADQMGQDAEDRMLAGLNVPAEGEPGGEPVLPTDPAAADAAAAAEFEQSVTATNARKDASVAKPPTQGAKPLKEDTPDGPRMPV